MKSSYPEDDANITTQLHFDDVDHKPIEEEERKESIENEPSGFKVHSLSTIDCTERRRVGDARGLRPSRVL